MLWILIRKILLFLACFEFAYSQSNIDEGQCLYHDGTDALAPVRTCTLPVQSYIAVVFHSNFIHFDFVLFRIISLHNMITSDSLFPYCNVFSQQHTY